MARTASRLAALCLMLGGVSVIARAESRGHGRGSATVHREPAHSVWDSVYSDSQAKRGDSLYQSACLACHAATLAGTDSGGPLMGKAFLSDWYGLTLSDLHDRIRNSMPPDKPKSIPRAQVTDILAYLLAQNHFPPGTKPLSSDAEQLKDIKIAETRATK